MSKREDIPKEFLQELGARMRRLFDKSKFKTFNELIIHLDNQISAATITDLMRGECNITAYNLKLILDALNGSADEVLFGKVPEKATIREIRVLLNQLESDHVDVEDKEIQEIIMLLGKLKKTDKPTFKMLKELLSPENTEMAKSIMNLIKLSVK